MPSDNYPSGMPSGRLQTVWMNCEDGHTWETEMWWEFGSYTETEKTEIHCPKCGKEDIS